MQTETGTQVKKITVCILTVCDGDKQSKRMSDKNSELGPLPPGWDTKFDPRTGK